MHSIHNEGKSVIAERFIITLKNNIYKYMTTISKNVYIDKSDDIVDEYNNTYHKTIKMKPVDIKDNAYIDFEKEVNDKDPKFKVGDYVRISKYKDIFAKNIFDTCQIGLKKFLLFVKSKIQFHGHMLLMILIVKKSLEHFMKKNYRRIIKKNLEKKKYIRKKAINYM